MKTVPLTKGYIAVVDEQDYDRVAAYSWYAKERRTKSGVTVYGQRATPVGHGKQTTVMLHRFIMGSSEKSQQIDHRDGDGLNNRRSNLRPATGNQNQSNRRKLSSATSRYKGVSWVKDRRRWDARIMRGGISLHLGYFHDEVDAATAYNFAAYDLFGEFARFNTPVP